MREQTVAPSLSLMGQSRPIWNFYGPGRCARIPTAVDKELGETNRKKGEKTTEIVIPTSWVDQGLAKSAELKAPASMLHNELSELIGSQVKMDQLRSQEAVTHMTSKAPC